MGISIEWYDDDKTIILQTYDGNWTWNEFKEILVVQVPAMMGEVSHPVSIFADFTKSDVPSMAGAMSNAKNVLDTFPDNWGFLFIIGGNSIINLLANTDSNLFRNSSGGKIRTAKTIDEAYQLVNSGESELV